MIYHTYMNVKDYVLNLPVLMRVRLWVWTYPMVARGSCCRARAPYVPRQSAYRRAPPKVSRAYLFSFLMPLQTQRLNPINKYTERAAEYPRLADPLVGWKHIFSYVKIENLYVPYLLKLSLIPYKHLTWINTVQVPIFH